MQGWTLHFLNARQRLAVHVDWLKHEVQTTRDLILKSAPDLALDIVIRASDYVLPPSLVVSGAAPGPGRIDLTLDTEQPLPMPELVGQLRRTLAHEYHHALRWDGPGYGRSLGEALASEGLAQRFVHEVTTFPPEPWEVAVEDDAIPALARQALGAFDERGYSHADWFFGRSGLPVWAGYTLGRAMIDRHLAMAPGETALSLAGAPASAFRAALSDLAAEG